MDWTTVLISSMLLTAFMLISNAWTNARERYVLEKAFTNTVLGLLIGLFGLKCLSDFSVNFRTGNLIMGFVIGLALYLVLSSIVVMYILAIATMIWKKYQRPIPSKLMKSFSISLILAFAILLWSSIWFILGVIPHWIFVFAIISLVSWTVDLGKYIRHIFVR